jgi:hypothetical protein
VISYAILVLWFMYTFWATESIRNNLAVNFNRNYSSFQKSPPTNSK